jgi:hypothetical protein
VTIYATDENATLTSTSEDVEFIHIAFISPAASSELISDGDMRFLNGETLITASEKMQIPLGSAMLLLERGTAVHIERKSGVVKIRALFENSARDVQLLLGNRKLSLRTGEEAILAPDKQTAIAAMQDNVARRRTDFVTAGDSVVGTSEISLLTALQNGALLPLLFRSRKKEDRVLAGKLTKMAACIMQSTSSHGTYSCSR